jgi:hypothetical protein
MNNMFGPPKPGGKRQGPVVRRGFEKRQQVEPTWPPGRVPRHEGRLAR